MRFRQRVSRRQNLAAIALLGLMAWVLVALVVLRTDGGQAAAQPLPLHPVAGEFVADTTTVSECGDQGCFGQALGNVAFRDGPKAALSLAERIYGGDTSPDCHRAAHMIGAAALARNEGDVGRTFAEGSSYCWSGYYHGVLERSLVNVSSYEAPALAAVARTLCSDARARVTPWIAYQCLHGLGHGLMISTGLNVPLSLDVCRRLDTRWDRGACKGGVFMENIAPSFGVRSRWLKDDDPVYPCDAVARADKYRCYQMVTSRILPSVRDDWSRTAVACSGVEQNFVSVCFESLGRDASSRSNRSPEGIAETCAVARPYGREGDCINGAAKDMTANFTSGSKAAALCRAVSAHLVVRCYEGIGAVTALLHTTPEQRAGYCRAIAGAPRAAAACVAAGVLALPRA